MARISSTISAANAAAAIPTVGIQVAAADEVSAAIATLFGSYAQDYQVLSAEVAAQQDQFVAALSAGQRRSRRRRSRRRWRRRSGWHRWDRRYRGRGWNWRCRRPRRARRCGRCRWHGSSRQCRERGHCRGAGW
nr:PE family protein [Mycobacterium simulans]